MNIVEKIEGQLMATRELVGNDIFGNLGEKCGKVSDLLFDDEKWTVRYLVATTGGYFKRENVLISPFLIKEPDLEKFHGSVLTTLTKDQVESSPPLDAHAPISRKYELELARHFEYPNYWHGVNLWGLFSAPGIVQHDPGEEIIHEERMEEISHSHLRSVETLLNYKVYAGVDDEEVGEVVDFILDSGTWTIRHIVIKTGSSLAAKTIVLSHEWISEISFEERQIKFSSLSHAVIGASPEFDYDKKLHRDFEKNLFDHYDKAYYWHL